MDPSTLLQSNKPPNGSSDSPASSTTSSAPTKMKTSSSSAGQPAPLNTSAGTPTSSNPPVPTTPIAPRLDCQAFYESLKTTLTKDQWTIYTTIMNAYLSGQCAEAEFQAKIASFIVGEKRRLHNAIIATMIGNMMRDAPGTDVAAWVSAGETKRESGKLPQGDVNERRIKKEVMAISARERRRIKEVHEKTQGIEDMLGNMLAEYHLAKQVRPPDMPPPRSAGLNKTNWDSEIQARYTLPLASETGEFPDTEAIKLRITAISYESGLPGGCAHDTASFMSTAAEIFVKEILTTIITRTRSNGPRYIQTDAYRRASSSTKLRKKLAARGREAMGAGPAGWGPERPLLSMHDVRLSLTLGDNLLTQLPVSMKKIMAGGWFERDYEVPQEWQFEDPSGEDVDGWDGAAAGDRRELRGLLDECLAYGG